MPFYVINRQHSVLFSFIFIGKLYRNPDEPLSQKQTNEMPVSKRPRENQPEKPFTSIQNSSPTHHAYCFGLAALIFMLTMLTIGPDDVDIFVFVLVLFGTIATTNILLIIQKLKN